MKTTGKPNEFPEELVHRMDIVKYPFNQTSPIEGWCVQGKNHQVVLWQGSEAFDSAEHSHPYAEWGVVLSGWCEVIVDGQMRRYNPGDEFSISADAVHSARMGPNYRAIDIFMSPSHVPTTAQDE